MLWKDRKGQTNMEALTLQKCVEMHENKSGYVVINAGKIMVVYTRKGDRHGKQQSAITCCSKGIGYVAGKGNECQGII